MNNEDMQKKFMEYQMLDQRIKQMKEQLEGADGQLVEIFATIQSLEDYNNLEEEPEILVPLNNGIFAKAKLSKDKKLRVNIGNGVVVDKTVDETKKLIEKQREELEKVRETIAKNIDLLTNKAAEIEMDLQKVMQNV